MNNDDDPILDACLAEVLGGQTPPDLSRRILSALKSDASHGESLDALSAQPLLPPTCIGLPAPILPSAIQKSNRVTPNRARSLRDRRIIVGASVALSLGGLALVSTVVILTRQSGDERGHHATGPATSVTRDTIGNQVRSPVASSAATPATSTAPPSALPSHRSASPALDPDLQRLTPRDSAVVTTPKSPVDSPDPVPFSETRPLTMDGLLASDKLPVARPNADIVSQVNSKIRAYWARQQGPVPKWITQEAWLRRAFAVLFGREPTPAESQKLTSDSLASRAQRIAELLDEEAHLEEFARRWSEVLADDFLPPELAATGSAAHRDGMLQYFRRALLDRRPFDRIATELLTATGTGMPGDVDYRGQANFLLARVGGKSEHATADSVRLLLGRDIACQQCHDDPRDTGRRQQEFWEFNAFFRQLVARRDDGSTLVKLADGDFASEDKPSAVQAMVFFETPEGLMKSAVPAFRGRTDLPRSGLIAEVNWRQVFARSVTTSREFRLATVNRIWTLAQGSGFAIGDDLSTVEPSLQDLLGDLGDQFASHGFDMRDLLSWILLSESFATPAADASPSLIADQRPLFQRFAGHSPGVRLPVQESLLAAAKIVGQSADSAAATAKIGTIPPGIGPSGKPELMAPGESSLGFHGVPASADPLIRRILTHPKLSTSQKAEHLCQLALHRPARRREMELVERLVMQAKDEPFKAWDLIWAALHPSAKP